MNFNCPIPYVKLYDLVIGSAVPNIIINNLDLVNYKFYRIYAYGIRPTVNNIPFLLRFSVDNGATFLSGAGDYIVAMDSIRSDGVASTVSGTGSAIQLSANASAASANHNLEFYLDFAPNNSANYTPIRFTSEIIVSPAALGLVERNIGMASITSPISVNAFQIFYSSGNINVGGRISVFGYPTL